jgi:hypothetical protein
MQVRQFSSQGNWLPEIFIPLQSIPVGTPDDVPGDYSNITPALCHRISDLLRRDPTLAHAAVFWDNLLANPAVTSGTFYDSPMQVNELFPSSLFKPMFSPLLAQPHTSNLPQLGFAVRPRSGVPSASSPSPGDLLLLTDRSVAEFVSTVNVFLFFLSLADQIVGDLFLFLLYPGKR